MPAPTDSPQRLRAFRWLLTLIAAVLIGLGVLNVLTQSYHGATTKLGGAQVDFEGVRAMVMGAAFIALGSAMLGVWFTSRKWMVAWFCAFVLASGGLVASIIHGAAR